MKYITKDEKLKEFIENKIIPVIKTKDLDYYKLLSYIEEHTGYSKSRIDEALLVYIRSKRIKEIRLLTVPDEKIEDWLELQKEHEKIKEETEQDIKEVFGD
jgi:hypothetical protein